VGVEVPILLLLLLLLQLLLLQFRGCRNLQDKSITGFMKSLTT
jgi:hypothetical protein